MIYKLVNIMYIEKQNIAFLLFMISQDSPGLSFFTLRKKQV